MNTHNQAVDMTFKRLFSNRFKQAFVLGFFSLLFKIPKGKNVAIKIVKSGDSDERSAVAKLLLTKFTVADVAEVTKLSLDELATLK